MAIDVHDTRNNEEISMSTNCLRNLERVSKALYDDSDELQIFTLNQKAFSTKQYYGELIEIFRELDHCDKVVMKDSEDVVVYQGAIDRF